MRKQEEMLVVSQTSIAKNIYELVLTGNLVTMMAQAGQFVNVKTGDGSLLLRRPISIAHIDQDKKELTIIYRAEGAGTTAMSQFKAGDKVDILGPLGTGFDLAAVAPEETVLLVGGGIGVPPMYETAKRLYQAGNKVIVVLGFASADDVFYEDQFEQYADVHIATMDGTAGFKGNVLELIHSENIEFDTILACGPHVMLNALAKAYQSSKKGFFSFEERMACGIGACYACIHEHKDGSRSRVCKEGPVYPLSEVALHE